MHERKKGGQRKDKKNERMREAVAERHEQQAPDKPTHDQKDVQAFKPGAPSDRNADPSFHHDRKARVQTPRPG